MLFGSLFEVCSQPLTLPHLLPHGFEILQDSLTFFVDKTSPKTFGSVFNASSHCFRIVSTMGITFVHIAFHRRQNSMLPLNF